MIQYLQRFLPGVIILAAGIFVSFKFYTFTADDAYIVLRYAENLVRDWEMAFNKGERINALTSPLHAIIAATLTLIAGKYVLLAWKILMFIFLLATVYLVAIQHLKKPLLFILPLLGFLLSPFLQLWVFGGLETILLLFFITLLAFLSQKTISESGLNKMCFIAGLAFITRFDSVIFTGPFLLTYCLIKGKNTLTFKLVFKAALLYAILPIFWFCFSLIYFKDIFPTSFYLKLESVFSIYTVIYSLQFYIFTGVLAFYMFGLAAVSIQHKKEVLLKHFLRYGHMYAGLFCITIYAFFTANAHMMFGYRMQLPYLGAAWLIVLNLLRKTTSTKAFFHKAIYVSMLVLFTFMQLVHCNYVFNYSLNGFSLTGEFREVGILGWNKYMAAMERSGEDIRNHLQSQKKLNNIPAKFSTSSEGIIPYMLNDLYVLGDLVSLRQKDGKLTPTYSKNAEYFYLENSHYIYVGLPYQNLIYKKLKDQPKQYEIISKQETNATGTIDSLIIFYNKDPRPIQLSKYTNN